MKKFNYLKGFIPIATAGVGGYISYQAAPPYKDTTTKLEMAKLNNQTEILQIESNEKIKLLELGIKSKEFGVDLRFKECPPYLKYPNANFIAQSNQGGGSILDASNAPPSGFNIPLPSGALENAPPTVTNETAGGHTIRIDSPLEDWDLQACLSAIDAYIENLSREQLWGLSFLLYTVVIIWCFSWVIGYSYLSRKTTDRGEKYSNNPYILFFMNIIRYSSIGLGYIYICTIYLCLGLSGGLAYYIFING